MTAAFYIGCISGTSRDGLDAALVDFENGRPDILLARCTEYPSRIRAELDGLLATGLRPPPECTYELDLQLGHFIARCCRDLIRDAGLEPRDICAIGSHGQTVWHEPDGDSPLSLQLGSGLVIANVTGVTTVTDFRAADIAAGGQGAPLAPLLHRDLFAADEASLAILNLGGIANLTLLAGDGNVRGFDCGPGNCLMDLWIQRHLGEPFDAGGAWAASGTPSAELLQRLLDEPWFDLPPPKSTGLEKFNASWLDSCLPGIDLSARDIQATLLELTVTTIARSLPRSDRPCRMLVCGGGVHNDFLMQRLREVLDPMTIASTAAHGVHPDWVEATLFAWLARERLADRPVDTRVITGARETVLLGVIHLP